MNNLTQLEIEKEREEFIRNNYTVIRQYLGFFMPMKLERTIFGSWLLKVERIQFREDFMGVTTVCFSSKGLLIPKPLVIVGEVLKSLSFTSSGIFRENSTDTRLSAIKTFIWDITEGKITMKDGITKFIKNYDSVDAAETYKQVLRSFNTSVISVEYFPLLVNIQGIEDTTHKFLCVRAFLFSLPELNRRILEHAIYVCHLIVEKLENLKPAKKHLDIDGIAVVMMPIIFLRKKEDLSMENVLVIVEFTKYLFKNFVKLIVL